MGKVAGKFVILLNLENVLSVEEIASLTGIEKLAGDTGIVPGSA